MNEFVKSLKREIVENDGGDFFIEEEKKAIYITETGYKNIEKRLIEIGFLHNHSDMYHDIGLKFLHYINNALKAHYLFFNNQQYIVKNGEVIIVDEFTGRLSEGRRWSDGLHQAIEAKENVEIKKENKTLATITYQNFFLLYNKLSGMTGTAATESLEFLNIYNLETLVLPTNKPIKRKDLQDVIYAKFNDKLNAIIEEIKKSHFKGQPVLVGTSSIKNSEIVANLLRKEGLKFNLLNAKYHEEEAEIIAQAGKLNAITIATNMAGRGTDIILGGNIKPLLKLIEINPNLVESERIKLIDKIKKEWEKEHKSVLHAGGLKVIGFEKNEARRIDNQLRGRAGRQGEIGESIFYLSLEDDLFRIFGGDKFKSLVSSLKIEDGTQLQNVLLNKLLYNIQIKVENNNYEIRKNLIEFDKILNEQRKIFYKLRNDILEEEDMFPYIEDMIEFFVEDLLNNNQIIPNSIYEQWNIDELKNAFSYLKLNDFITEDIIKKWKNEDFYLIKQSIIRGILEAYVENTKTLDKSSKNYIEKTTVLERMDKYWQYHLTNMDKVKEFIHLRVFAQKDPKQEYKKEAHQGFLYLFDMIKIEVVEFLLKTKFLTHNEEVI
jgi:preprotein translocase subunit SecA